MTVKIKKLTPPQIAALREALPACVDAGVLTTTNSIATFHDKPFLKGPWARRHVARLIESRLDVNPRSTLYSVLRKVSERPDLVEEVAA